MAINLDHVTEQITVTDAATNASLTVQPKGTGAFNIAAGSSGVNLSNGGTVTAITRTVAGSGYTSVPSVAISAPTTAGGVQAIATANVGPNSIAVTSGGTGYTLNDVLTLVGGTGTALVVTVTAVSGGVVTSVAYSSGGIYTVAPSNPVSTTGGTGSGCTLTLTYYVNAFTITNAGSGYVEQPTVTFSGGGGSGAAAYATVGSPPIIRSLAGAGSGTQSLSFYGSSGEALRLNTSTTSLPAINYGYVSPGAQNNGIQIGSQGADTNIWLGLTTKGSGNVQFLTGGGNNEQLRVAHTASAVNYVQVTGAATGSAVNLSAQGSDTNIQFNINSKNAFGIQFGTGGGTQFLVSNTAAAANYLRATGGATGSGVTLSAQGSDTNIDLNLTTKGTGSVRFNTGSGEQVRIVNSTTSDYWVMQGSPTILYPDGTSANRNAALSSKGTSAVQLYTNGGNQLQLNVSHTASAVNYVQVTGAATGVSPSILGTGSDATVGLQLGGKGGSIDFRNNGIGTALQFSVAFTASAVNQLEATGSTTGFGAVLRATGSDSNVPVVIQPKGTGALQAQQTDSTATGGNARGANAVDWQTSRGVAGQVASGTFSNIGGGFGNLVSGFASSIAGGYDNNPASAFSGVGGGRANLTSSNAVYSFVGGGRSNISSGAYNFIGGGFTNSGTANAAVTTQSATMNGTTAVTLAASNANIKVGQYISGTSIADDTYVAAVSGTSLTLSKVASGSSTNNLSFFTPHGVVVGGGNNQATGSYSFIGGGGDAGTAGNRNVASGAWSTVAGGVKNVASGVSSFVGGGGTDGAGTYYSNTASGISSVISGGWNNNNSGSYGVIAGGQSNTVSNSIATIAGGTNNYADGFGSAIVGGTYGTTRAISGNIVFPASVSPISSSIYGASQAALLVLGVQTTDATATVLRSNTSAAGTANQVILPNNSAYYFRGEVVSGVTGGGNTKGWFIEGVIKRGANAASTALVGTPTVTSMYADVGAATWAIAVTADTTNGGLAVTFTGQAGTTIRTVAKISTVEMTF